MSRDPLFACGCFAEVNAKLAEHNAELLTNILGRSGMMFISTNKKDSKKRGKPPLVCVSFCPFCGAAKAEHQI